MIPRGIEYDRAPRPVSFRPYSLSDMRARAFDPKTAHAYWRLGSLGPDFTQQEAWRTLRAKADRQRGYGLAQSQVNRDRIAAARPAAPLPHRVPTSRERALAFARSVPRPRPAPDQPQHQPDNKAKHSQARMRPLAPALDNQKQCIAAVIRTALQDGPGAAISSAEPTVVNNRARIATTDSIQEANDAAEAGLTCADTARDDTCLETEQLRQQLHNPATDLQAAWRAHPVQEPAVALPAPAAATASQLQEGKVAEARCLCKLADLQEQPAFNELKKEGPAIRASEAQAFAPVRDAVDHVVAAAEEPQQDGSGTASAALTNQGSSEQMAKDENCTKEEAAGSELAEEDPAGESFLMRGLPADDMHWNEASAADLDVQLKPAAATRQDPLTDTSVKSSTAVTRTSTNATESREAAKVEEGHEQSQQLAAVLPGEERPDGCSTESANAMAATAEDDE